MLPPVDAAVVYGVPVTQWRVGEALGHGAVGRVVRIHREGDETPLAGKILHASHRSDPAARARFFQEARITAALSHVNIVRVFGVESIDGEDVLVMEYVEGPTLATHIARNAPLGESEILTLARQLAAGLAHAHERGIVHRDLKPANILLAGEVPKIADFGMARASSLGTDDAPGLTGQPAALAVLGTPDYMAPECLDPLAIDGRADLYALGCIILEMATGRPPFAGATPHAVLRAHRDEQAPPAPDALSAGLRALIRALLAKSPGQRPQAAGAVVATLEQIARGETAALALGVDDVTMRCAVCGLPLVAGVGACLSCGQALLRHESGPWSVVVVGPGEVGDKIDSELRERLCGWLASQPDLGLGPTKALARRIPRLPFTLARGLAREQADAIVIALGDFGVVAETTRRHPLWLAPMRRKAATMSGRVGLVALTSSAGLIGSGPGLGFGLLATAVLILATTFFSARRVTRTEAQRAALPPALRFALARTVVALPAIVSDRHRDAVRAVVERATDLARHPSFVADADVSEDLARAVDAATLAAAALEQLDARLLGTRLGGETTPTRDLLRTRDLWAGRLQSVLAELDTIRDRLARARTNALARVGDQDLVALRAHVEALEEVQR